MYSNPTQICSLTTSPTSPDNATPFAPLITAKVDGSNILIRSILFVDQKAASVTFPANVIINGTEQKNPSLSGNTLTYYFTYNYTEETPSAYNTWYTEQSYPNNPNITDVEVYLLDTDPVTSRGTRTTVQQS